MGDLTLKPTDRWTSKHHLEANRESNVNSGIIKPLLDSLDGKGITLLQLLETLGWCIGILFRNQPTDSNNRSSISFLSLRSYLLDHYWLAHRISILCLLMIPLPALV